MVKEKLRERAGLKKDVMLIGRFDHFLIWDKATWESKSIAQIPYEDAIAAAGR
jgi:DNA-binding transcriptional regulator/RsmH inhibitor MraZ